MTVYPLETFKFCFMNYSAESLYDVMSNVLKDEMSKNSFWNNSDERVAMIISYAIDDKHFELRYDEKENIMSYYCLTPFGGLMLDLSSIIMDFNIKIEDDGFYWDFFEKIASLFLRDNMCEIDEYFYNEIKSGKLKLDWRGITTIDLTEEENLLTKLLRKYLGEDYGKEDLDK